MSEANEPKTSVLDSFFLKLGTVLSMTKDALLADFLGDLPSYAPDLQPLLEAGDREAFKTELGKAGSQLAGFIERIFRRLGYDMTSFEENKELVDLVTSIFATAESLGESVAALAEGGIPWEQELEAIGKANQPKQNEGGKEEKKGEEKKEDDKKKEDKEQRFLTPDDVFKDDDGNSRIHLEGENGSLDISFLDPGDGKLGAIVKIASNLIDLIKKFRDLEWSKVEAEGGAFIQYLDETYFTEKFAERLFDHILVVLLSKAREVFDDEIKEIARTIDEYKDFIEKQIKEAAEPIAETVEDVIQQIQDIKKQIEEVKQQIEKEVQSLYEQVCEEAEAVYDQAMAEAMGLYNQVSGELQAQLRMLENELLALTKMSLGPFGTLGDLLDRIYRVLDFLGLIRKQNIEIARFIPVNSGARAVGTAVGATTMAAQEVEKLLNAVNPITPLTGEIDTKRLEGLDKKAEEAVKELKNHIPTVEIYVVRWSRLEQLFTSPKDYFKEVFPLHDYDDAEALVLRLVALVRSFNPDIPDFSSITAILNDLLARLIRFVQNSGTALSEDIRKAIDAIVDFILEVKRVLEAYAYKFKDLMSQAFVTVKEVAKDAKKEADSTLDTLKKLVREAAQKAEAEANTLLQGTKVALNDLANLAGLDTAGKQLLYKLFAQPLEELVAEKAAEYGLLAGVDPAKWTEAIRTSFCATGQNVNSLAQAYLTIINQFKTRVRTALNEDMWNARFRQAADELEQEFRKQTAAIPKSTTDLAAVGKDLVTHLLQGNVDKMANPFSSFDINAYFTIISDKVKAILPSDPDLYYLQFRDATVQGIGAIVQSVTRWDNAFLTAATAITDEAQERAKAFTSFVSDVYAGYWPRLKDAFCKVILRPILTAVEKAVKQWAKQFLHQLIEAVKDLIDQETLKNAAKAVGALVDMTEKAGKLAEEILLLKQEGEEVDTWQEGIALAIKVYELIPETVKEYVRDIINIPDINVDFHLPDYKLDMKNKFLAVQLYELKPARKVSKKYTVGGSVSIQLLAFVGEREVKDENDNPVKRTGLYLYPSVQGELKTSFALGSKHKLDLNASAGLNDALEIKDAEKSEETASAFKDGIGLFFTEKGDFAIDVIPIANLDAVSAYLELYFARGTIDGTEVAPFILYDSKVFGITVGNYPQKTYIGYSDQTFDVGYRGELDNVVFRLSLKELNGFFDKLLSGDIKFSIDKFFVGYSYQNGLDIGGSASVRIPINKTIDLKAAKLSNLALEVGVPDFRGLQVGVSTNLALTLGCINFSLSDLGFGLKTQLLDNNWHFKDFNLSPTLKLPDGMGISIATEGVKGAGALSWNQDTGEIRGAFSLVIVELCSAGAWFVLNTKPQDGVKFSFMGAVSAAFNPGIQLGMGFSLTGVGGALGLFRRIDTDRMQRAVHDGTLSTVLFAKDVEKNLDTVLANITDYFPLSKENFFFGAMAQISWAEKVKVDMGLFIQVPDPVVIMIAGGLHFNVADSADKLLSINSHFLGIIDFSKGLSFDASLYDSYIVGIQFYGDIALRIYWAGETKGFLLSAGGFHPQYKPEAGFNVSDLKRLGMKFDIECVQLSMEEYFAVTSNTVQFGSDTRLKIGWDKFGLSGYMYYNVLFQFRPFAFMFDAGIGVAVKCGSWTLMSIALALEVSGPSPWHIKGKASFWFLLVKIKCSFSATWGKKQQVGEQERVCVITRFSDNFAKPDNWTVISSDIMDNLVELAPYKGDELMMKSSDTLLFSQDEVPLDEDIERFGESIPSVTRLDLDSVYVGVAGNEMELGKEPVSSSFAPSMFRNMTDQDKLTAKSFVDMNSGFRVKAGKDVAFCEKPQPVSSAPEYVPVEFDEAAWKNAIAQCNKTQKSTTATKTLAKTIVPTPKKTGTSTKKVVVEDLRMNGKGNVPAGRRYRPSSRRTDEGFRRYIKELDAAMGYSLKGKLEE